MRRSGRLESDNSPAFEVDPSTIAVVTTTFYRGWRSGIVDEQSQVDKVRGNLALQTLQASLVAGYQTVVIDGGSSEDFLTALRGQGIKPQPEIERGMSLSRQQGFREAAELEGIKIIVWTEPEKVSLVHDCLPQAVMPILLGETDIVVPSRSDHSFKTYPDYQVVYEQRANKLWNNILRSRGLLPETITDLDVWFGPKFFRNDHDLVDLFLRRYLFAAGKRKLDQIVKPQLWPNAIFLPIIAALRQGYRVKSVSVPYDHPQEQTALESDSNEFRRKRQVQLKNIIDSTIHFIRLLEADPNKNSRLTLTP